MKDKNKYDQLEMELSKGTLEAITVNEEEKEPREEKIAEKTEEGLHNTSSLPQERIQKRL